MMLTNVVVSTILKRTDQVKYVYIILLFSLSFVRDHAVLSHLELYIIII